MCSTLWWILYIWEAICWNFSHFALIHALSTRRRSLCMFWAPGSIWKVFQLVRAVFEKFGAGPVSRGGLTAPKAVRWQAGSLTAWCRRSNHPSKVSKIFLFVAFPYCIAALVQGECALAQGELAYVQGELFVLFALWIGVLCSLLEHGFISDVSSCCPCLRGPRLVLIQVILLFAFLWLSIACWSFFFIRSCLFIFSRITICVCCQCTHQGEDWGPCVVRGPVDGRFLVWWVFVNVVWTNSWLSIAGAGCGFTSVGAGEEQARKVVAGEASKCGEDK
jgi:hypothetical protein